MASLPELRFACSYERLAGLESVSRKDINIIENVQRRFTKSISVMHNLPYLRRLKELGELSLQNKRFYNDMVFAYKAAHGLMNCAAEELGISKLRSRTSGGGIWLEQKRATTCTFANLYSLRVTSRWNKLPLEITSCASLSAFKNKLFNQLLHFQS